jgi:hypothetical protein
VIKKIKFTKKKLNFISLIVNKMENISKELNYSPVVNNHSSIVYRTVSPQAGGNVNLNNGSSVGPTEFLIPPSCWIPEHTRLSFDINIPGKANVSTFVNANLLTLIDRITVYDTATSNLLLDCSNFHKYASLMSSAATKLDDYLTKTCIETKTNASYVDLAAAGDNPLEDISKNTQTVNDNPVNEDLEDVNPFLGRRQWYIGADDATAANGDVYLCVNIPFSALKMTALASDKIWYSPSSLVIQIYWSSTTNFAFTATGNADPDTGDAAIDTQAVIVRPQLFLANEGNLAIVSQVINKVMSGGGIQLPIAYPTVIQTTTTATTSQSFQYQLTRGYGNRILALVTAAFSTGGVAQNNYHARFVTTQYNTFLNNVAILAPSGFIGNLATAASTDYALANKRYLVGSVIQNQLEYKFAEWIHIDGFFGNKPLHMVDQHQVDGLDVTAQSSTWQLQAEVTSAAYKWFTAVIGQKTMSLTAQGVMVQ